MIAVGYLATGNSFNEPFPELNEQEAESFDCHVDPGLENQNLGEFVNRWVGGIYSTYPPNHYSFDNPKDGAFWSITTNSQGLREEELSLEKPSDTFRILVIGDSYTFGWGLNRSQRYTDVLEERLSSRYKRDIEVVNMGRTNAGMRDYYLALKDKGMEYDPDLVVVSFYKWDYLSARDSKIATDRIMERYEVEERNQLWENTSLRKKYRNEKIEMVPNQVNWKGSPFEKYGNGIEYLTRKNDVAAVFFLFTHGQSEQGERFARLAERWGSNCGAEVILPPEEYYEKPFEEHTLPQDQHFNPEYNRHMADKLYSYINENYLN